MSALGDQFRQLPGVLLEVYTNDIDASFLRQAIQLAQQEAELDGFPFGCVIVAKNGEVLVKTANNTRETGDCTGHAEILAVREVSSKFSPETLCEATLYTSAEPCVMCSGAIYWSQIRRIVYGIDAESLRYLHGETTNKTDILISPVAVFSASPVKATIIGPMLLSEAAQPHVKHT